MIRDLGIIEPGTTLYVPFHTFDSNDPSSSVTLTGLATTDIEIYKDGSVTQRASDAGYALLDTDGIDFDATTGIHGISINLADNTTAGFYAAGSQYWVVIASVTVDAATVNFVLCTFRIGYQNARLNTTIATLASQTSFTLTNGPAEDDALNGCWCIIHDVASAVQQGHAIISDYTGSTKTVTLAAGTTFTAAATDNISIMGPMPMQPTVSGRTLDVSAGGEAGMDWANIGSPTTAQNLSATNIDVDQVVASVSGAVGSVTGAVGSVTGAVGSVTGAVGSVTGNVGGNVTGSVGSIASGGITEASFATTAGSYYPLGIVDQGTMQAGSTGTTAVLRAGLSLANDIVNGAVLVVTGGTGAGQARYVIDFVGATDTVTVDTWTTTPDNTSTYKLIAGPPPSSSDIAALADAVWDELLSGHAISGSAGEALSAAGTAGDPWTTALPGAYGAGTAGKIVGDNINATISSRASQTSVDDVPTNAELATALGTADDAVLAAIAALNNLSQANIRTAVGLASANLDTQLADLPTNAELATALGTADDAVLAAIAALNNLSSAQAQTAAAAALTAYDPPTRAELTTDTNSVLTAVGDVPTNAELATALAAADDAVLAAIAALNNLSAAQVNAEVVDALNTDTYAEPASVPAATASLAAKIGFLTAMVRNRKTQTATTTALRNDADSGNIGTSTVSDDATTAVVGEWT